MNNIFAMSTMRSSHFYTSYALKSFYNNTNMDDSDEFLLIDNDGNDMSSFVDYKKINIIKNKTSLSFAENVNQGIQAAKDKKKNIIFLNNDIIFTKDWFSALDSNAKSISIPVCNQLFQYQSDCGKLKLKHTMKLEDFGENYNLLNEIIEKHKIKFKKYKKFQTPLMPFYCFKIPYVILNEVGYFDSSFGKCGGEDIDYRIRCAIKGYEVDFLLQSYLLHFHGKSSWDGNETKEQIEERNRVYTETFNKKWGLEFTQIFILRRDFLEILNKKNLNSTFKAGEFGELIRKLK